VTLMWAGLPEVILALPLCLCICFQYFLEACSICLYSQGLLSLMPFEPHPGEPLQGNIDKPVVLYSLQLCRGIIRPKLGAVLAPFYGPH